MNFLSIKPCCPFKNLVTCDFSKKKHMVEIAFLIYLIFFIYSTYFFYTNNILTNGKVIKKKLLFLSLRLQVFASPQQKEKLINFSSHNPPNTKNKIINLQTSSVYGFLKSVFSYTLIINNVN